MAIEIVDLPIKKMVIFHGYVSLREGIQKVLKLGHSCLQHPLNRRAWQVESAIASSLTQRSEYRLNDPERAPLWWWTIIATRVVVIVIMMIIMMITMIMIMIFSVVILQPGTWIADS